MRHPDFSIDSATTRIYDRWFKASSFEEHIQSMIDSGQIVDSEVFQSLVDAAPAGLPRDLVYRLGAKRYANSTGFDNADLRFRRLVSPFVKDWPLALLDELISDISNNGQTYGRRSARADHMLIRAAWEALSGVVMTKPSNDEVATSFGF